MTTKTTVKAAVIPVVANDAKQVFLKVAKANAQTSLAATIRNLIEEKNDAFEGEIKFFVKEHGIKNLKVWESKVAFIKPTRIAKSAAVQIKMWKKLGYEVVNHEQFVPVVEQVQAEATVQ